MNARPPSVGPASSSRDSGSGSGIHRLIPIQILDDSLGNISCVADVNEGGKLGAGCPTGLKHMVETFLLGDFLHDETYVLE